jgi:hypothetical protein
MSGLIWKEGDLQPDERVQLTERDPTVTPNAANPTPRRGIDLTNATSVVLVCRTRDRKRTVTVTCSPDGGQNVDTDPYTGRGWVTVTPTVGLTQQRSQFQGEFLITWTSGDTQRVPNSGWIPVTIEEALS